MTGPDLVLVTRDCDFAALRHVQQRRKGVAGEPYINHLAEVATLLAVATGGNDPALVAAGFLHDTLEDTPTTHDELAALFGPDVAHLVSEVTDDKSLTKAERKCLQITMTPSKSVRAKLIKVADKTSNVRAMASSPAAGWDIARIAEYIEWAQQVVASCRGLNAMLEQAFDAAVGQARAAVAGLAA